MADQENPKPGPPLTDLHAVNPPPVQYRSWQDPEPRSGSAFGKFFLGVLAGNGLLGAGFFVLAAGTGVAPGTVIIVSLIGEIALGIVLVIVSGEWRPFGIGMIAAAPIGALIFIVGCFVILSASGFKI